MIEQVQHERPIVRLITTRAAIRAEHVLHFPLIWNGTNAVTAIAVPAGSPVWIQGDCDRPYDFFGSAVRAR